MLVEPFQVVSRYESPLSGLESFKDLGYGGTRCPRESKTLQGLRVRMRYPLRVLSWIVSHIAEIPRVLAKFEIRARHGRAWRVLLAVNRFLAFAQS